MKNFNSGYLLNIIEQESAVIVINELSKNELDYLHALLKLMNVNNVYTHYDLKPSSLLKGDVVILDVIYDDILKELLDWSLKIHAVGRFDTEQRNVLYQLGVTTLWDLDMYSFLEISKVFLKKFRDYYSIHAYIWSENMDFNKRLQSIFYSYSIQYISSNNPDFALYMLREHHYELLLLDWDLTGGLEIQFTIQEIRTIKELKKQFPFVVGIKDFSKENLFNDLTLGIKEFCPMLFSYNEVIELMIRSLPFVASTTSGKVSYLEELPFLKWKYDTEKKKLGFEYSKEYPLDPENELVLQYELDKMMFRKQFEWILKVL
jgi:hypothetical protein